MIYKKFLFALLISLLYFVWAPAAHSEQLIAFSLRRAMERIQSLEGKDYRKIHPEIFHLGYITKIRGLVYDRQKKDIILVGERDPDRAILTLDDLVVALRSRLIHGKWPLISIDPTPETKRTNLQHVRSEGGIENTAFCEDLFDADYRLKKMGMGLLPSGVDGLRTYWDLSVEEIRQKPSKQWKIESRIWLYPIVSNVAVREGVVAIRDLRIGVFTEVLYAEVDGKPVKDLTTFEHPIGNQFAQEVGDHYDEICRTHQSFARVQGLNELVALVRGIEGMGERPDVSWWLKEYKVKEVETPKEIEVLRREYQYPEHYPQYYFELSGGVQLMAIALRLKAGEVTALKKAVFMTRPNPDQIIWTFIVEDWGIATAPDGVEAGDIAELWAQAEFLYQKEKYDLAIACWRQVARIYPEMGEIYYRIGDAFEQKGMLVCAADYYTKGLQFDPFLRKLPNLVPALGRDQDREQSR